MSMESDRPSSGGAPPARAAMAPDHVLLVAAGVPRRRGLAGVVVRLLSRLLRSRPVAAWLLGLGLAVVVTVLALAGLAGWSAWNLLRHAQDFRFELLIDGIREGGR